MTVTLTKKDLEIIETLTLRLRVMSVRQVRELWWSTSDSSDGVRRRLTRLQWHGYVSVCEVQAHPTLPVTVPLMTWSPGEAVPDFEMLSTRVNARWSQPAVSMTVVIATEASGHLMGCRAGRLPSDEHLDRDLRLASLYVDWRQTNNHRAIEWKNKRTLTAKDLTCCSPDVMLQAREGRIHEAIDAAGRWSVRQFENLHLDCVQRQLKYEVW